MKKNNYLFALLLLNSLYILPTFAGNLAKAVPDNYNTDAYQKLPQRGFYNSFGGAHFDQPIYKGAPLSEGIVVTREGKGYSNLLLEGDGVAVEFQKKNGVSEKYVKNEQDRGRLKIKIKEGDRAIIYGEPNIIGVKNTEESKSHFNHHSISDSTKQVSTPSPETSSQNPSQHDSGEVQYREIQDSSHRSSNDNLQEESIKNQQQELRRKGSMDEAASPASRQQELRAGADPQGLMQQDFVIDAQLQALRQQQPAAEQVLMQQEPGGEAQLQALREQEPAAEQVLIQQEPGGEAQLQALRPVGAIVNVRQDVREQNYNSERLSAVNDDISSQSTDDVVDSCDNRGIPQRKIHFNPKNIIDNIEKPKMPYNPGNPDDPFKPTPGTIGIPNPNKNMPNPNIHPLEPINKKGKKFQLGKNKAAAAGEGTIGALLSTKDDGALYIESLYSAFDAINAAQQGMMGNKGIIGREKLENITECNDSSGKRVIKRTVQEGILKPYNSLNVSITPLFNYSNSTETTGTFNDVDDSNQALYYTGNWDVTNMHSGAMVNLTYNKGNMRYGLFGGGSYFTSKSDPKTDVDARPNLNDEYPFRNITTKSGFVGLGIGYGNNNCGFYGNLTGMLGYNKGLTKDKTFYVLDLNPDNTDPLFGDIYYDEPTKSFTSTGMLLLGYQHPLNSTTSVGIFGSAGVNYHSFSEQSFDGKGSVVSMDLKNPVSPIPDSDFNFQGKVNNKNIAVFRGELGARLVKKMNDNLSFSFEPSVVFKRSPKEFETTTSYDVKDKNIKFNNADKIVKFTQDFPQTGWTLRNTVSGAAKVGLEMKTTSGITTSVNVKGELGKNTKSFSVGLSIGKNF